MKYVNPFTDFGFKKIFGDEQNKEVLIAFLNSLLPEIHQIKTLEFQKNERLGLYDYERKVIYDLYCENEKGDKFIVELQKSKQTYFKDRTLYYSTFPIREQAEKGDWNFKLTAVYCIAILDFTFDSRPQHLHIVQLKNQHQQVFYDKLMFVYVEMPKFKKSVDELKTPADKWLYLFNNLATLQSLPPSLEQEAYFPRVMEMAALSQFSDAEMEIYHTSLKNRWDWNAVLETAVEAASEKSLQKGREEGREETQIATAIKLKNLGIPREIILASTGIDINDLDLQ
jgi:predicted transposase/invertase (TIGR01784 family)